MPPRRPPRLAAALAFATALLAARGASAQFDAGVTTATNFDATDFFIGIQAVPNANLSDFQVLRFFNVANCQCNVPVYIYVTLVDSGFAKRTAVQANLTTSSSIEFWLGQSCDNTTLRGLTCILLKQESLIEFLMQGHDTLTTDTQTMSAIVLPGVPDAGVIGKNTSCTTAVTGSTFNQIIWVLISPTGATGQYAPEVTRSVQIDLVPPPPPDPSTITVEGGNQALIVNWQKLDTALNTDLLGYQILCNRAGSLQVFDTGAFTPGFLTCPTTIPPGSGVSGLDPAFVCSPLLTTSASSYRVKILQNDIVYGVSVVSVDNSGNASAPDIFYGTPIKTKSFYDVYRDGNTGSPTDLPGGATGGFCALGPRARSARVPALAVAGLAAALGALASRRRRRR
jgi:hypothetical protein